MVTIKQVAQKAGVSKSTVSRYISQKGYVSEETRKKIRLAIDDLHYSPNVIAQSLKTKKNQLVGLLLPDISNPFFSRLAKGVEAFLKEQGYRVMLGSISAGKEVEEEYLHILLQSNAAGIITTNDFTKSYPELKIPVVVVDRVIKETEYGVFSDNKTGGKLAAEAIFRGGANKVLLIRGTFDGAEHVNQRFKASYSYLRNKDSEVIICESHSFDFEEIQRETRLNFKKFIEVDSIIAPSDVHAIAYIHELLSYGKSIPEDVQIVGYDDILMSQFIYPSLSTIHQSSYQMGYKAAELIYNITNHLSVEEKRIKLPVYYVDRETVRKVI